MPRKWSELKTIRQKKRRLKHIVRDFFRYNIWGDYKRGGVMGLYHWIRCHVWNRYHVINISGEDDYSWGWMDRDHIMIMACFKILKMFVEQEDPKIGLRSLDDYRYEGDECMLESLKAQLEREAEVRALYIWWTETRPKEHAECATLLNDFDVSFTKKGIKVSDEKKSHGWFERTQELDKKDEEMLIRLMKVRRNLWT